MALPLLGYTTKKSGESQERVIRETHDVLMAELEETKDIHLELHNESQETQKEIKELIEQIKKSLPK